MGVSATVALFSLESATLVTGWYMVTAMAINMVASAIITKAFFSPNQPNGGGFSPDVGNRAQVPPATNNKLPVVYGDAWLGGTVIDLTISENNQEIYYVIAISEVTNNGADTITFGDCYWGGKKVIFNADGYTVDALLDESTGIEDDTVNGRIRIYFYNNGGIYSNLSVADTNWHSLWIVEGSDNNHHWLYLDGVKCSAEINSGLSGALCGFGRLDGSLSQDNASIDNVQWYDRIPTDTEIAFLAAATSQNITLPSGSLSIIGVGGAIAGGSIMGASLQ